MPAPKPRGTLLVVDDEEGPRMSLKVIFKDVYDLLLAADGEQALALARQHEIDVVILDIRMAGMSGIEVLERLREARPHLEAIMVTAFETADTIRQALRLRACDYINKPFDIATIRNAVSQAMQRRHSENEILQSAGKVNQLIAELQSQGVAEQIARTRCDIYASIIHDINSPLTVAAGLVQLLNHKLNANAPLQAADTEFIKERLTGIERQVGSCIEIARRYLSFLHRQSADQAVAGVNQLFADLEQLIRVHPSLQENEFRLKLINSGVSAKINGTDLIQILINLAVNAFQSTATPHWVEVSGEVLDAAPDFTTFKDGPNDRLLHAGNLGDARPVVKLWVKDNGPGIAPEALPRIFEPYFTTKGPQQGTGLGLNIVQRLITETRGALHVHTRRGQGTTFTLYLPGVNWMK